MAFIQETKVSARDYLCKLNERPIQVKYFHMHAAVGSTPGSIHPLNTKKVRSKYAFQYPLLSENKPAAYFLRGLRLSGDRQEFMPL